MRTLLIASAIMLTFTLASCGKGKKEGAMLLPLVGLAMAGQPAVPASDLAPVSTDGISGGGTVTAIVGESSNSGETAAEVAASSSDSSATTETPATSSQSQSASESTGSADSKTETNSGSKSDSTVTTAGASSSSSDSTGATTLTVNGSDYNYLEGTWYKDGTSMFTYEKNKAIGFSLSSLKPGKYRVTVKAKHWVASGEEETLPSGYTSFQLLAAAGGTSGSLSIPASTTEYNTSTVELNVTGGDDILLLSFENPTCGLPSLTITDGKAAVCHIPPGNPANAHTLLVGENAVKAHLAHGDYSGACQVCTNLEISTVKLERVGDASALASFTRGAGRNWLVSIGILAFGALGFLAAAYYTKKRKSVI